MNKFHYDIVIMKYYTSVKINEPKLHRSTWINFMNIMLREK